jgi:DNA-binding HxlR family transcriptional regulator
MTRYGQYCPIAKALELLGERWTLLIVRELLMGSRRFNDLRRGVPLVAPSMMSQRLRSLVDCGILVRDPGPGKAREYRLTSAGEELRPLILQLGTWGQRWSRSRMTADDLDASFLMWDIRRNVVLKELPPGRTVIAFEFPDAKRGMRHWWLVAEEDQVDLCLDDPGYEVDVSILVSLRTMTRIWMGDESFANARAKGLLKLFGPSHLVRKFAGWFALSPFAHVAPAAKSLTRPAKSAAADAVSR